MLLRTALVSLAVALPVAVTTGIPAEALSVPAPTSVVATSDPAGDVRTFYGPVHPSPPDEQVLPDRRNGDIIRTRLTQTRTTVRVLLRFRELAPYGEQHFYGFRFASPRIIRDVFFRAYPGKNGPIDRGGYWSGTRPTMQGPAGATKRCAGMNRTIDYRANSVLLVVPRSCLGNPQKVGVGARVAIVTNYQSGSFDDAHGPGGTYGDPPAVGPRAWSPAALAD